MKTRAGFTLVEMIIIIFVLTVLITLSVFSTNKIQQRGRDAVRESNVAVIAEALEKYFDKNGQYPGCTSMTASAATVSSTTLKNIDVEALVAPSAATGVTNSIQCADLLVNTEDDYFAYVVDSSPGCQTGNACTAWVLKYKEEESNTVISVQNRR